MKKRSVISNLAVIIATLAMVLPCDINVYAGEPYTGNPYEYHVWLDDYAVDNDTGMEKCTMFHFDFVTNGKKKTTVYERRMVFQGVDSVWIGNPQVICCDACRARAESADLYSVRIFLEDDNGREILSRSGVRFTEADLKSTGIDFETYSTPLRIGIELEQRPKELCSSCSSHIGDNITIDGIFCHRTCMVVQSQPVDTTVDPGGEAHFSIKLSKYAMTHTPDPRSFYKWAIKEDDGTWRWLGDGVGEYGEIYRDTGKPTLTISNVTGALHGQEYVVAMNGTYGKIVYSDPVKVYETGYGQSQNDPDPSPEPLPGPQVPDGPDDPVTPDTPIVPKGGSSSSYKPSSSSSYVVPSSSTSASPGVPKPSYSSSSSSNRTKDDDDGYKGSINTPVIPGSGQIIPADPASPTSVPGTKGGNGSKGSSSKGSSSKGTSSKGSSSSGSTSSGTGSYVSRKPNSSTVMKNGILYVIDDDGGSIGTKGELAEKDDMKEESIDNENAYSAADLASNDALLEKEITKGFFDTVPGYIVIILSALLLLLLALFFLFFGVIIFGEVEEHDEVFGLCAIRLLMRRDGNWYINLSSLFDDNAVVKLRIGLLTAVIFEGWDLVGKSEGVYEGSVTGRMEQNIQMHRKDVRRSV